jgi:cytochrome P450
LSAQDVRDQILIFLLAGHETTSTALTFTCHLLGQHPDQQRRLRQEIDAVLGGRAPTADDLGTLTDTAMAIKKAMRLYPPVPALGRFSPTGDQIGGYRIPPGAVVILSPWVTHRRPTCGPTRTGSTRTASTPRPPPTTATPTCSSPADRVECHIMPRHPATEGGR